MNDMKTDQPAQAPAELTEGQLDQAAGGAAYLKIGDIKGEAVETGSSPKLMDAAATGKRL